MSCILHTRITKQAVDRLLAGEMIRDRNLSGFGVRRQSASRTVVSAHHGNSEHPSERRVPRFIQLARMLASPEMRPR
jgi:hypothetical protein